MKCDLCKGNIVTQSNQRHNYTESGLDNVYLDNIELLVCRKCGDQSPVIPRILDLHAAIARSIALQATPLRGEDLRFLRKQLGMRARDWSRLLRVDTSTFSRWENNEQQMGAQSDALVRFLYFRLSEEKESRYGLEPIIEKIASVDFERTDVHTVVVDMNSLQLTVYRDPREVPPRIERHFDAVVVSRTSTTPRVEEHWQELLHPVPVKTNTQAEQLGPEELCKAMAQVA